MDGKKLPAAAVVVGVLQILFGAHGLIDMLIKLPAAEYTFNVTILYIPTGIGLLMRRTWGRIFGRALHVVYVMLVPTCLGVTLLGIAAAGVPGAEVAVSISDESPVLQSLKVLFGLLVYGLNVWAIFVLGRAGVIRACD